MLVADLLCGAGGSSTGCARALAELNLQMDLVCVNHWQISIDTHELNHPEARHFVQDIATVRPRELVPEGRLDLLMASPTCTHHSVARGGRPTSDQQRSDPWHIIAWLTQLRVKRIIIENVWEFRDWGPIDERTGRPIKSRKGEYFRAWIAALEGLGFKVEWRKLNAADYGDATTRQRFILMGRSDGKRIVWPETSHAKTVERPTLFDGQKQWRPSREIIDWGIKGRSIFNRPIPLAPKTLARILSGAERFGWPAVLCRMVLAELERSIRFYLPRAFAARHVAKKSARLQARKRVVAYATWLRQLRAVAERPGTSWAQPDPMVVTLRRNADGRSVNRPLPTASAGGTHIGLAEPIVLAPGSYGAPRGTGQPLATITTGGAGAEDPGCARPMLVEPFVLSQGAGGAPRATRKPLPTLATDGAVALISPYYGSGSGETCLPATEPLPTVTSKGRFGMVVPITHSGGVDRARDVNAVGLPTITTANRGELAFIAAQFGERPGQTPRVHDIEQPAPAICATGHVNLVEVVDKRPWVEGEPEECDGSAWDRLPPAVRADVDHSEYDVLFRMLEPHELAAAMGFEDYKFTGTKTQKIKQIGNAVSVSKMKACVKALMADAAPRIEAMLEAAE